MGLPSSHSLQALMLIRSFSLAVCRHTRGHAPPPLGASRVASIPLAVTTTPAEALGACIARFPSTSGLPKILDGSASTLPVSRPAQRSLHVTACLLAESPNDPFHQRLRSLRYTSTTAPIATGWSDSHRAGISPAEEPYLGTAHQNIRVRTLQQRVRLSGCGCYDTRTDPVTSNAGRPTSVIGTTTACSVPE